MDKKYLKSYYEKNDEFNGKLTVLNIDDVFKKLIEDGVTETICSRAEMLTACLFIVGVYMNSRASTMEEINGVLKIINEGKVDKLFGINLILEE